VNANLKIGSIAIIAIIIPNNFCVIYILGILLLALLGAIVRFFFKEGASYFFFFLVAVTPAIVSKIYLEFTEIRLDFIVSKLDAYKGKYGYYPKKLQDIEVSSLPYYRGLSSVYVSTGNYFFLKYQHNNGVLGRSMGYTSKDRYFGIHRPGWDG
jgi:hypothetical protein